MPFLTNFPPPLCLKQLKIFQHSTCFDKHTIFKQMRMIFLTNKRDLDLTYCFVARIPGYLTSLVYQPQALLIRKPSSKMAA